jgi:tetratricopeptide (TPR) repeat protein
MVLVIVMILVGTVILGVLEHLKESAPKELKSRYTWFFFLGLVCFACLQIGFAVRDNSDRVRAAKHEAAADSIMRDIRSASVEVKSLAVSSQADMARFKSETEANLFAVRALNETLRTISTAGMYGATRAYATEKRIDPHAMTSLQFAQEVNQAVTRDTAGLSAAADPQAGSVTDAESLFLTATEELNRGEPTSAIELLTAAIAIDSTAFGAYINRGLAKTRTGDIKGAIDDYTHAIVHSGGVSERALALKNRGVALKGSGKTKEAIADYLSAAKLTPHDATIYYNLANAYVALGNLPTADTYATRAIVLDSAFAAAYSLRGDIRQRTNDGEDWQADYRAAAEHAPTASLRLYFLAYLYRKLKMRDSSIVYARLALDEDPIDPRTLSLMGLTLAESANQLVDLGLGESARPLWLEAIAAYRASLERPRIAKTEADQYRRLLLLARRRYEELYGTPPD